MFHSLNPHAAEKLAEEKDRQTFVIGKTLDCRVVPVPVRYGFLLPSFCVRVFVSRDHQG
jgi:hypothetical protein